MHGNFGLDMRVEGHDSAKKYMNEWKLWRNVQLNENYRRDKVSKVNNEC